MSAGRKFTTESVTDSKRLVRGEHYLAAGRLLRARKLEKLSPRLMTLGGFSFLEDVNAALFKDAFGASCEIVVIDKDPEVARRVNESGVSQARGVAADLFAIERAHGASNGPSLPWEIESLGKFDAINLDFCSPVFRSVVQCVSIVNSRMIVAGGCLMVTCSYGRDNADFFLSAARGGVLSPAIRGEMDGLAGRVMTLVPSAFKVKFNTVDRERERSPWTLVSALAYKGRSAPMFSVLFQKKGCWVAENIQRLDGVLRVTDGDLRDVLVGEGGDCSPLYGTPASRIAAWRAVASRRVSQLAPLASDAAVSTEAS